MATPPVWRQLPASSSNSLPNLLVSTTFSKTAYTIHVTDLANIWVESMDRKAIWKRSLNESTSIDPTDSDNNMRAFLSKIQSVFDSSHEDHSKATMTLSTNHNREAGEGGLTLSLTCELDNMNPLEWPVYLQKCPQSKLTTELIVPLAQASSVGRRQVDSLAEIIKQKDTVIMKLLDKLEATGTRLENVFTVLSAKQKPTRKMAEEKVKGLGPFRLDEWKSQLAGDREDISTLVQDVFGAAGLEYDHKVDMNDTASLDNWWAIPESFSILAQEAGGSEADNGKALADDDDDDFQIQSTPPHLMSTRNRSEKPPSIGHDDSTEDEDISQIPDSVPVPPQEHKSRSARLGTIGQRRQPSPTRTSPPPKATELEGSATETESDEDAGAPSPAQTTEPQAITRSQKGGLGRIGGGDNRHKGPESLSKGGLGRIGGTANQSKSPEPLRRGGLGRIGAGTRPSKTPEPTVAETGERGRSRTEILPQEKPRETSQERADRKRDELQKELQRKAASGPARKKRKF
ncbi:hypothetical protein EsH8_VII_001015 [Colletotrichum jinshuiense]